MTETDERSHCYKLFRKIQARSIEEDDLGKAKSFRMCGVGRPHMRGFHTSWFSFLIAFTAWFGIQPLLPTIRKELGLSKSEIAQSGIASLSATLFVRIAVGPFCDRYGPKRVMSGLLIIGGAPLAFTGLVKNGTGLILVRLCIGILGGTFIPCQFWTSAMFNVKIVGTANALVGGWGSLGGGFTFILMPALFELVKTFGADEFLAWKIALVFPAVFAIAFGILILWTSDDCPQGDWSMKKVPQKEMLINERANHDETDITYAAEAKQQGLDNKAFDINKEKKIPIPNTDAKDNKVPNVPNVITGLGERMDSGEESSFSKRFWLILTVTVLMIQYGLCSGIENSIKTVMNLYFLYKFKKDDCVEGVQEITQTNATTAMTMNTTIVPLEDPNKCSILSQNTASFIASLSGLMNLFARALGGIFSDFLRRHLSIPGRLLAHIICMTSEGVFLIIFSQMETIPSAIITLVAFSLFVQMTEGTAFAIVPCIHPRPVGIISGFIGAGGNSGGLIWTTLWLQMVEEDPSRWFLVLGICVLCGSVLTLFIRVQRQRIWNVLNKSSTVSDSGPFY